MKARDLREDFHPFELISPVQTCDVDGFSLVRPSDTATMTSQPPSLNLLAYPILMNLLERVFETPRDLLNLRKTSREFYFLINNYLTTDRTVESLTKATKSAEYSQQIRDVGRDCTSGVSVIEKLQKSQTQGIIEYRKRDTTFEEYLHGLQPTHLYEIRWEAEKWMEDQEMQACPLAFDMALYMQFRSRFDPTWSPKEGKAQLDEYAKYLYYWVSTHDPDVWASRPWRLQHFPLHTSCIFAKPNTDHQTSSCLERTKQMDDKYFSLCGNFSLTISAFPEILRRPLFWGLSNPRPRGGAMSWPTPCDGAFSVACGCTEFELLIWESGEVILRRKRETAEERWLFENGLKRGTLHAVCVRVDGDQVEIEPFS